MRISFEVDARLIVVTSGCGFVGLFVLHGAYPGLFSFWPTSSQDLAAWVQAVGSVVAILASAWIASAQLRHSRQLERDKYLNRLRSYEGLIAAAADLVAGVLPNCYSYGSVEYFLAEEYDDRERVVLLDALSEIRFEWLESSEASLALLELRKTLRDLDRLLESLRSLDQSSWEWYCMDPDYFDWLKSIEERSANSKATLLGIIGAATSAGV